MKRDFHWKDAWTALQSGGCFRQMQASNGHSVAENNVRNLPLYKKDKRLLCIWRTLVLNSNETDYDCSDSASDSESWINQ